MKFPDLTYTCAECDVESPPWDDEPLGLCHYTGRPHGGFGGDPGPCDCGASSKWLCDDCASDEPDFEAIVQGKHDRQEDDFNAKWPI